MSHIFCLITWNLTQIPHWQVAGRFLKANSWLWMCLFLLSACFSSLTLACTVLIGKHPNTKTRLQPFCQSLRHTSSWKNSHGLHGEFRSMHSAFHPAHSLLLISAGTIRVSAGAPKQCLALIALTHSKDATLGAQAEPLTHMGPDCTLSRTYG